MRRVPGAVPLVLLSWGLGDAGRAQGQDRRESRETSPPSWCALSEEQAEFLRHTRTATEAYRNAAAAMANGFRPVGADAPAMGRHWVNLPRLLDGRIDAAEPEILTYAVVGTRETLVGVGFAFEADAWHVHSGRLDMESHRMDHVGGGLAGTRSVAHGQKTAAGGVSVLHAWVWTDNPAGVLQPNNWALPYVRLGLSRPFDATPEADRAISLASLGADFFLASAELLAEPLDSGPAAGWREALRRAETEVAEWWRTRPGQPLTPAEVEWLGDLWRRFAPAGTIVEK